MRRPLRVSVGQSVTHIIRTNSAAEHRSPSRQPGPTGRSVDVLVGRRVYPVALSSSASGMNSVLRMAVSQDFAILLPSPLFRGDSSSSRCDFDTNCRWKPYILPSARFRGDGRRASGVSGRPLARSTVAIPVRVVLTLLQVPMEFVFVSKVDRKGRMACCSSQFRICTPL